MANLQNSLVSTGRDLESASQSGIAGYVFFWQNWLSYPEKYAVRACLLAATLTFALLIPVSAHQIRMRRASFVVGTLCFLSFASTVWDWQRFDNTTHAVVVSHQAIARKGNSETYETAFADPLTVGTKLVVPESRNDWLHVRHWPRSRTDPRDR